MENPRPEGGMGALPGLIHVIRGVFGEVELAEMPTAQQQEEWDMGLEESLGTLKGYAGTPVVDEDFPPFAGEYVASWTVLRPWVNKETQQKEAYLAQWKVAQTLDGDTADNRVLSRFYRIAGATFDGATVDDAAATEALKKLADDAATFGVSLDLSSIERLEASFANAIGASGFLRAWHFTAKDDPDRRIQQFVCKQEKHLRKGSKDTAGGKTARAPF